MEKCNWCDSRPAREGKKSCEVCAAKQKEYRVNNPREQVDEGICRRCRHRQSLPGRKQCGPCTEKSRLRKRLRVAEGKCRDCNNAAMPDVTYCSCCLKQHTDNNRRRMVALKHEVFSHYGGCFCSCCGEKYFEFLTIDHVNGGGGKHRKEMGQGYSIYPWLKKHGFPSGYRVLCYNCNCCLGFYGYCAHDAIDNSQKWATMFATSIMEKTNDEANTRTSEQLAARGCAEIHKDL